MGSSHHPTLSKPRLAGPLPLAFPLLLSLLSCRLGWLRLLLRLKNSIPSQLQGQQERERQWQRAYQRRLTASEIEEKTTETETRSSLSTVYACIGCFPPKSERPRISTNQIIALPARARLLARAAGKLLRVYKASLVVSRSFGQGLARVRLR